MKILAIQFRYLGDAVLMTPALRAISERFPEADLHVLVPAEVAPLLRHLPWLKRVWAFPRERGRANLGASWPLLRQLCRERFDRSVDFAPSDRSALITLACGARERLAPRSSGGFWGRNFCYTRRVFTQKARHPSLGNFQVLTAWQIQPPETPQIEIRPDPALAARAAELLPEPSILAHISTSQPRKEWPLEHWAEFHRQATAAGFRVVFSSGVTPREQTLLQGLRDLAPGSTTLPAMPDLALFVAVLQRARLLVCGCTGPLHFAAALGVPTIGLFGPSPPSYWAPLGAQHRVLQGAECPCRETQVCLSPTPCMAAISPVSVLGLLQQKLPVSA